MPNIKSAKKRVLINKENRMMNKSYKSELATAMKKYVKAVESGDKALAAKLLPETASILDKNVSRNIIHKNKADRKKAEFTRMLNNMKEPAKKVAEKKEPAKEVKKEEVVEVTAEVKAPAKKRTTTKKTTTAKKTTKAE